MLSHQLTVDADFLRVTFDNFGLDAYSLFLRAKRLPEYTVLLDGAGLACGLQAPARFAALLGVAVPVPVVDELPFPSFLFDDQAAEVRMAVEGRRFAIWSDCGLGKTLVIREWARQVVHRSRGGRVLIVELNDVVAEFLAQDRQFYGDEPPLVRLESRAAMREWCRTGCVDGVETAVTIAVTNYEKFNHDGESDQVVSELKLLAGVALDESSRLSTGGGKQKWALIKSARGIQYKLSCTATPAPNDLMEFASQAAFLEKLRADSVENAAEQIIWTYFTRDSTTHRWTVKQHARRAFFEWMGSWSIFVRDPRRYGWRQGWRPPPEPVYVRHEIRITAEQRDIVYAFNADPKNTSDADRGSMFAGSVNATTATKLSQAAKGFVYGDLDRSLSPKHAAYCKGGRRRVTPVASNKPAFVAHLVLGEAGERATGGRGLRTLVWTVFDEETDILARLLGGAPFGVEVLTGRTPDADREAILARFASGETQVLISRAAMIGYGRNLQYVRSMVFSGWSFSYVQFYQAIRRAYRHGQRYRVRVHLPVIPELEGQMYEAIVRKQRQHEEAIAEMESNYVKARLGLGSTSEERAA